MKGLFKLVVVLALLWCGYWFVAMQGAKSALASWFAAQGDRGWQAEFAEIETSGFPFALNTELKAPVLADPTTGVAWRSDRLNLNSPAIWPGYLTVSFTDQPQRFSYFDKSVDLVAKNLTAILRLHPGSALEVEQMALSSEPWALRDEDGVIFGAQDLRLEAKQAEATDVYGLEFSAKDFQPGAAVRRNLRLPADWPVLFTQLDLDLVVDFDRPWDRQALETARPQPQDIHLKTAAAAWGDLRVFAAGRVAVDETGVPDGFVEIKAENWREILTLAENSGALPPQLRDSAEQILSTLAGFGRNPDALDVRLNFRNGYVAVGPIPIAPAPRLILR